jgi:cyanophycin synthetase
MHTNPTHGTGRNVAKPILEMLFPDGQWRIPIVVMPQGDNHMLFSLLMELALRNNVTAGYASKEEAYINGHTVCTGSLAQNVHCVLSDRTMEFAAFEYDGNNSGDSGFDQCTVAIITDEKHKNLVKYCSAPGFAVLNIDAVDPATLADASACNVTVYSASGNTEKVQRYAAHGTCAWTEEDQLHIRRNGEDKSVKIPDRYRDHTEIFSVAILTACALGWETELND